MLPIEEENFNGTLTFDEVTILADIKGSISSFKFTSNTFSASIIDGEIESDVDLSALPPFPLSASVAVTHLFNNPLDFLSEVWLGETKVNKDDLSSLTPLFGSNTVDFRLVFENGVSITLIGKINPFSVVSNPTPDINLPTCEAGTDPKIIKKGEGTALWWWSSDATSAIINNDIGSVALPTEYKWIHPSETTTYIMVVKDENGASSSCQTTIIVEGETSPVCEMGADPQVINAGEGAALWWWSSSVASASINHNVSNITIPTDYTWFHPTETTTYTMDAVGTNGVTSHY